MTEASEISLCVPNQAEYLRVIRQIAMVVGAKADLTLEALDEGQLASDEAANIFNRGTGSINVGGNGSCFVKQAGSAAINCARIEKGSPK